MIVTDPNRTVPEDWTDELCADLVDHARWLGMNGNPGAWIITKELADFCCYPGETAEGKRVLKPENQWDYDGIRQWIADNPSDVRTAWQRDVREPW